MQNIPDTDIYSFVFGHEETGSYSLILQSKQIGFINAPSESLDWLKSNVNSLARHDVGLREPDVVTFLFSKSRNLDLGTG